MLKAILLFVLLVFSSNAQDQQYTLGEKIYNKACVSCHGLDGKKAKGVSFIVNPRDLKKTILREDQAYLVVKDGAHKHGSAADIMPAFKTVLNEEELRAVTHYMYKKFDPQADERISELYAQSDEIPAAKKAKMAKRGAKIYKRNCSWCHGKSGDGDGEATRNPEKSIYPYNLVTSLLDEKQMFLYVKYGGHFWGTDKKDMPSWAKKYDDYTIKSVIYHIEKELKGNK